MSQKNLDSLLVTARSVIVEAFSQVHLFRRRRTCACIVFSRQDTPLTIDTFVEIASFFAERDEKHPTSRKLFYGFIRRNCEDVCLRHGKLTSPVRNYKQMLAKTKESISAFECIMAERNISENNIVVFDESIIGDCASLPKVISELKDSGGGNANTIAVRRKSLGSIIPFSMNDG